MAIIIDPHRLRRLDRPRWPYRLNADTRQAEGLVAWYPIGDGLPREFDLLHNQRLTAAGTVPPLWTPGGGMGGGSAYFDPSQQSHFELATPWVTTLPLSIVAWVKFLNVPPSNAPHVVASIGSLTGNRVQFMGDYTSEVEARIYDSTNYYVNAPTYNVWHVGEWAHVGGVFNSTSELHGIIDAELSGAAGGWVVDPGTFTTSYIGARPHTDGSLRDFPNAYITDVRVYNRALTPGDVTEMFDPATRWDLYWTPSRIAIFDFAAPALPASVQSIITGRLQNLTQTLYPPQVAGVVLTQSVTTATITSTLQVFAPSVTTGPVSIIGVHRPTSIQVFAPSIAVGPVTVTGAHRATTIQVFAPSAIPLISGPTIGSGSGAFPPSVIQTVLLVHRPTTIQVFIPTVVLPAVQPIAGATIASTVVLRAPTVTTGPVAVGLPVIVPTGQVFAPSIAPGPVAITTAHRPTAIAVNPPAVAVGAVTVVTPAWSSSTQLYTPLISLAGVVNIATGFIASATQLYPPLVTTGAITIGGGHCSSAISCNPPSVTTTTFVIGAHRPTTIQCFAPSVTVGATSIGGATCGSTATVYPPSVVQIAAGAVVTALIGSTIQVFPPTVVGAGAVTTGPIGSTSQIFPPSVSLFVSGMTIGSTVQVFAPALSYELKLAFIPSESQCFVPAVRLHVSGATIGSTVQVFPPSCTYAVGGAFIGSLIQIFPPLIRPGITTALISSTVFVYPPRIEPEIGTIVVGGIGPETLLFPPSLAKVLPPTTCLVSGIAVRYLVTSATIGGMTTAESAGVRVTYVPIQPTAPVLQVMGEIKTRTLVTSDGLHVCCLEKVHD